MKPPEEEGDYFELDLNDGKTVVVPSVPRPTKKPPATKKKDGDKREQLEVLVIDKIDFDPGSNNKFDVVINAPKESAREVGPQ